MPKTRFVIFGAAFVIVIIIVLGIFLGFFRKTNHGPSGTIKIWGVFDDRGAFSRAIDSFISAYPQIHIQYEKKNSVTYDNDLIQAFAAGQGPDIFMIHNDWLWSYADKLIPFATTTYTLAQLHQDYPEIVEKDFVRNNQIYALPLSIDTLALFWNRDLFNRAGIPQPPQTWTELMKFMPRFMRFDNRGNITQSAVALGTANNIDRAQDIYSLIALQLGEQFTNITQNGNELKGSVVFGNADGAAAQALNFYNQFANPTSSLYNWNKDVHYSIDNFAEGTVAMIFTYAYNIADIENKNAKLNFAVAPMPQVNPEQARITYPNYWGFAMAKSSKIEPLVLQLLVTTLTSKDNASYYLTQTKKPAARRDLLEQQYSDPVLGVFAQQTLQAKDWIKPDASKTDDVINTMIDNVFSGKETVQEAVANASNRIYELFSH